VSEIEEKAKVFVGYAITLYLGKKASTNVEGFEAGATLELLPIGLLKRHDQRFDILSPRKKRRIA